MAALSLHWGVRIRAPGFTAAAHEGLMCGIALRRYARFRGPAMQLRVDTATGFHPAMRSACGQNRNPGRESQTCVRLGVGGDIDQAGKHRVVRDRDSTDAHGAADRQPESRRPFCPRAG